MQWKNFSKMPFSTKFWEKNYDFFAQKTETSA